MIKVGVLGALGYVGQELVRLLHQHPQVDIELLGSRSDEGTRFSDVYGQWRDILDTPLETVSLAEAAFRCDLVFLALPHGVAGEWVDEEILQATRIIDMGADFRLKNPDVYATWYGKEHPCPELLEQSIYGLCEFPLVPLGNQRLVANPGCYTTCSILALLPLMGMDEFDIHNIVIDAKSGVSGAGRSAVLGTHFAETNETIKAYKVAAHRHTPEIEEQLSLAAGRPLRVLFTPHLVPMNRGILSTCYIRYGESLDLDAVRAKYEEYYDEQTFVRVLPNGVLPETRWVKGTNYCDIGLVQDTRTKHLIVIAALDNVIKGAAGQGVQNMNRMFGWPETLGLNAPAIFPA